MPHALQKCDKGFGCQRQNIGMKRFAYRIPTSLVAWKWHDFVRCMKGSYRVSTFEIGKIKCSHLGK